MRQLGQFILICLPALGLLLGACGLFVGMLYVVLIMIKAVLL